MVALFEGSNPGVEAGGHVAECFVLDCGIGVDFTELVAETFGHFVLMLDHDGLFFEFFVLFFLFCLDPADGVFHAAPVVVGELGAGL